MQFPTFTRAALAHDLGADLHRWSRAVATAVAFTYVAGMATGVLVHWLNDRLSGGRRPWPVRLGSMFDAKPDVVAVTALTLDGAGRIRRLEPPLQMVVTKQANASGLAPLFAGRRGCVPLHQMRVAELRQIARDMGIRRAGGRPIHLARHDDLVAAIRPQVGPR